MKSDDISDVLDSLNDWFLFFRKKSHKATITIMRAKQIIEEQQETIKKLCDERFLTVLATLQTKPNERETTEQVSVYPVKNAHQCQKPNINH